MYLSKPQETVKDREAWHAAVHGVSRIGHNLATEQQQQSLKIFLPNFIYILVSCVEVWWCECVHVQQLFNKQIYAKALGHVKLMLAFRVFLP